MELHLSRTKKNPVSTLGYLSIDGRFECVTLEDKWRPDPNPATPANEAKVYGETCIPAGRYKLAKHWSPKFKKWMIEVCNVPGFTGILIHSGNTDKDTRGCLLVGQKVVNDDYIQGGSVAMPALFAKVYPLLDRGEDVWVNITDDFGA